MISLKEVSALCLDVSSDIFILGFSDQYVSLFLLHNDSIYAGTVYIFQDWDSVVTSGFIQTAIKS